MHKKFARELIDFIYESPTAFHAVKKIKMELEAAEFRELKEGDRWNIINGGKYYVTKNDSAIIAFTVGKKSPAEKGFRIVGAHTDSPGFRIKPNPEMSEGKHYIKLNTEVYGSPILSTWFDRPLALAGRVILKTDNPIYPETQLININKPVMVIPNLSIHMNRNVNDGVTLNRQKETLPLIATINEGLSKDNLIIKVIAKELKVKEKEILDFDLFTYEYEKGEIIGLNEEFISSSRLDDLSMVHAGLQALIKAGESDGTNVLACYDNEEVGSSTKQGADSELLSGILERIILSMKGDREDYFRSLAKSFLISADLAHALHPNYAEKNDPVIKPVLNGGPVIKVAASQSYTTDADSSAVYQEICRKADVPCQKFVNRSDMRGGSTIGPISSTHLNLRSVDMGSPLLGMHALRELAGVSDHYYTFRSFEEFY
ncbi:MAG: M18 family aminopeptidase, partial [Clostridiaceae bacterium]